MNGKKGIAPISTSWEYIGPDEASAYLGLMIKNNRLLRQSKVDQYARAMKTGEWLSAAGDSIAFDVDGALLDGQHRLWGVLEADTEVLFRVDRNVPHETLFVYDTGMPRHLRDFLHINGEKNAPILAATITLLMGYETHGVMDRKIFSKVTSVQEAMQFLDENPNLRESIPAGDGARKHLRGGCRWAALHYVFSNIDAGDTADFLKKVETGEDLKPGHPVLALRRRLLSDMRSLKKMREVEYNALIIKAWNAYRNGEDIQVLSWKGGGASPELFPVPV